ncbi:hypothetical protein KBZ00_15870 [Streptomyces sp. RK31]|nr:hypothetical protein [Streptomyces sp. RK31]
MFACARVVFNDALRARREAHAGGAAVHQGHRSSEADRHRRQAHRGAGLARRGVLRGAGAGARRPAYRLPEAVHELMTGSGATGR